MERQAKADIAHIRQTTQYTCTAASIASAIKAYGRDITEEDVNRVMGAAPMSGATWEAMMATLQYFGFRGTLVIPATPRMLKEWTDQGIPVLIGWNPEGRPWSHASTVFDVTEDETGLTIHTMDPNIPNPTKTVRSMHEDEFCQKWYEKMSDTLIVRRPACAVTLEVSTQGQQKVASMDRYVDEHGRGRDDEGNRWQHGPSGYRSTGPSMKSEDIRAALQTALNKQPGNNFIQSLLQQHNQGRRLSQKQLEAAANILRKMGLPAYANLLTKTAGDNMAGFQTQEDKRDKARRLVIKQEDIVQRNPVVEQMLNRGWGAGSHHNRSRDVETGRSRKPKHKKRFDMEASIRNVVDRYTDGE